MRIFQSMLLTVFTIFSSNLLASSVPGPLVDSKWLADNLKNVIVLEVRKDIKSYTAKPKYKKDKKSGKQKLISVGGHIPGSSLVNYKKVRSNRTIDGKKVKFVIPEKSKFETLIQNAGANKDSTIVIVSKGESFKDTMMSTRLYWQLKYYGHDNLTILNGGTAQWIVDGQKISSAKSKPKKGNWIVTKERKQMLASSEDVKKATSNNSTQLVDTRSMSQYLGAWKKPYVFGDGGHIPTAKVFPNEMLTTPAIPVKFFPGKKFNKMAKQLGIDSKAKSITYCNSGHLASGSWFVMHELLGNKDAKLYDGSMHQWTLEKNPTVTMKME